MLPVYVFLPNRFIGNRLQIGCVTFIVLYFLSHRKIEGDNSKKIVDCTFGSPVDHVLSTNSDISNNFPKKIRQKTDR